MSLNLKPAEPSSRPSRRIALEGASNFRDLGGYQTEDGRQVRWRRVFRSGALDKLTGADLETIADLRLRTVCDLRHAREQEASPSRLPRGAPPETVNLPILTTANAKLRAVLAEAHAPDAAAAAKAALAESYGCYVRDHADTYRGLMHRLADQANHPLMFHCSAGKDRTGFGAALILMTLGVPEEVVYEDYRLTNTYWTEGRQRVAGDMPEAVRDAVIAADDVYLRAAIDMLHELHESLEDYLAGPLAMDADDVTRLRALLLE